MNLVRTMLPLAMLIVAAFHVLPARAQDDSAKQPAQTEAEKAQAEATRMMEAWVKALVEFCKDTRLTEADLKKWIQLAPSFNAIGEEEEEEEDAFEKCYKDGKFLYEYILKDEDYGKWAREHGVDPTQWLKKHLRITMFLMREQGLKHIEMAQAQVPEQLKQIENKKSQLDAKTYEHMKSSFEASLAALEQTKKLYTSIPKPGEAEAKLLKKHEAKLLELLEDDEDDEDEDFDEFDDEEEMEGEEDDD